MDTYLSAPPVLRDFLVYMQTILGRSPRTVAEYSRDLRMFFRFLLQKRGLVAPDTDFDEIDISGIDLAFIGAVTRGEILDFLLYLANERPRYHKSAATPYGNQAGTRARKVTALRSFYRYYCDKVGLLQENPTQSLDTPKRKKSLPKFLSLSESIALLSAVDGRYAMRDRCILTLFLHCGMRVSELCGINLSDIQDDTLRLLGKGNKERIVYLNDACQQALREYFPHRLPPKPAHKPALFISREGNRINPQTVKWLVKKYLSDAGLGPRGLSAHKLRHTAATLMYQNGVDVRTLKEVLGHENLDTTMIYTHVLSENLRQAAQQNPLNDIVIPKPKK